ncbi:MAG: M12 family metallo-peptidase [Colwellia sp.]
MVKTKGLNCLFIGTVISLLSFVAVASNQGVDESSQFSQWKIRSEKSLQIESDQQQIPAYRAKNPQKLTANIAQLQQLLLGEQQAFIVSLPLPNGQLVDYRLRHTSVMANGLAEHYANIKTFTGYQLDNKQNTGRFDITPNGFHGMFHYDGQLVYIDPERRSLTQIQTSFLYSSTLQNERYLSYYRKDASHLAGVEAIELFSPKNKLSQLIDETKQSSVDRASKSAPKSTAIRTYRLAVSAVGEYTQFNGGTVDSAMAEIITMVNRLNEVYQRDFSIKLELVANNNLLVFTDPATDPFANNSDDGGINTEIIDDLIGNSNYDIGHVVSTGGGGLAILGGVCNTRYKGDGVTGDPNPINDAFYIDYVAHEVGHQFGANHTFNGVEGSCDGNRDFVAAYEPGSASTIMGYAGLCGSQDLQNNSDAFFHAKSIDEVSAYINSSDGRNCGADSAQSNNAAIVDAGKDFTIPAQTPFILTGSATDADGDTLMYSWEQFDLGTSSNSSNDMIDDGLRPLFRVWQPTAEPIRILPRMEDVLQNTTVIGEVYPTTTRNVNFRLMVRDGNGGVSFDAMRVFVVDTSEAFAVTSPLANDTWSVLNQTVYWNVAETTAVPISCASVDILLSSDGGNSFEYVLASGVANNGSADISLASITNQQANSEKSRLKIACSDNIFFAVNQGDFTITAIIPENINIDAQQSISVQEGSSVQLTANMFTYSGTFSDTAKVSITVAGGNDYVVSESTVTPDANFSGTLFVDVIAKVNAVSSEIFTAKITVVATPEPVNSSSGGSVFWLLLSSMALLSRWLKTVNITVLSKGVK